METTRPAGSSEIGLVEGVVGPARAEAARGATEGTALNHATGRHAGDRLGLDLEKGWAHACFRMKEPVLA